MILGPERVSIPSRHAEAIVAARIRDMANEWRESSLSPQARKAGILGWRLHAASQGEIVLRPRLDRRNDFRPTFAGRIERTASGAVVTGELRMSPFARIGMSAWFSGACLAPVLALVAPIPGEPWSWLRVPFAILMSVAAGALVWVGRWLVKQGRGAPSRAIIEFLETAAGE